MKKKNNFERAFELATSIAREMDFSTKTAGGERLKLGPKHQSELFNKFVGDYVHNAVSRAAISSNHAETRVAKIRAFSGSSDLPELTNDVFNSTAQTPNYDMGWSDVFRTVQLMQGQLSWEIATTKSGEGFVLVGEGDSVDIASISGQKITAYVQKYGAGLAVTWEMIEGRKLYAFAQALETMRAELFRVWADTHYGILAAAGAKNSQAYPKTGTVLQNDISVLNSAYVKIGEATKNSGYGDTATAPMRLFASPRLSSRINAALRATTADTARGASGSGAMVEHPIEFQTTYTGKIPVNHALLVLPGHRIQNAIYMREMGFQKQDILTLSDIQTYWTAFGAVVADGNQVVDLAFV